eukprot:1157910-Pelagomonas_calceolata.AAC.2
MVEVRCSTCTMLGGARKKDRFLSGHVMGIEVSKRNEEFGLAVEPLTGWNQLPTALIGAPRGCDIF